MVTKIIEYNSPAERLNSLQHVTLRGCTQGKSHKLPPPYDKRNGIKEADILRDTKQILLALGIWHRRIDAAGKIVHAQNGAIFIPGAMRGLPDVIGCLTGGRLLALECKAPGGLISAEQYGVLTDLRELGACVGIVVDPSKLPIFLIENLAKNWLNRIAVI